MLPVHTILHPTDFSERSKDAFHFGCSLARDLGARLIVLHVIERPSIVYSGVMTAPPPPPPSEDERRAAREQLHQIEAPDAGVNIQHRLEQGEPVRAILQVAQEEKCGLIVMGTHGRTGLSRVLMGSVAEKVVREASCPVLTVKSPFPEARSN